ncbi:MAG TPA: SDR family NAD(P)-dependent oxidoreductase, partial [Blastococcus sp.]
MTETTGRVAIVTGSESGIGRAIAVALARQGCDVGITWHRDEAAGE